MKSFSYLVGRDGILKNSKIMDFIFKPSWKITSIEGWLSRFSKSKKNEDGRSAKTLAEFCKTNDAEKIIVDILNPIVGDVNSIEAYPEYHTKIDKFGKGRMHDLAIKCKENEVFVGIEAKVNEDFGPSLKSKYNGAKKNSNIKKRIDNLLSEYYNGMISIDKNPNIPYQLIYSAVSVLNEPEIKIPIFIILVFHTNKSEEKKVKKNKCKLCDFLQAIKAIKTINNRSAEYYEATLNGKKLNIVYKEIDMVK